MTGYKARAHYLRDFGGIQKGDRADAVTLPPPQSFLHLAGRADLRPPCAHNQHKATLMAKLSERLLWFMMRTPYLHIVKGLKRLRHAGAVRRRRRQFGPVQLDAVQAAAVQSLRQYGYADARDLVDPALLRAAYETAQHKTHNLKLTETTRLNPGKDFWERLLDEDEDAEGRQPSGSPFVQLAIDERVLDVVAEYLGDAPLLDYVYLLHSTHRPGPLKVSQLWHMDHDDTSVLKLFTYFTDCETPEDGPFTFLPADLSAKVPFSLHSHRADDDMGLPDIHAHARAMKAPKLAAFLLDTSRCYHMGSRVAKGHERVLYMGTFTTFPKFLGRPTSHFAVTAPVSAKQQVALTYG